MKNFITPIVSLLIFSSANSQQNIVPDLQLKENEEFKLIFSKDSGFIKKEDGFRFLLSKSLTRKSDSWSLIKNDDTIGKYYKLKNTDNFLICLLDYSDEYSFETHLLLKLKSNGDVIKTERFLHSNYSCCWGNYYEGFNKNGDYFSIKTCGTGSGYCASYLCLFKNIQSQNKQKSIPESYWSSRGKETQSLSSTSELKNDSLTMHYKLENGTLDDSLNFNIESTKQFDIKYFFKDNKWQTKNDKNLKGLDIWQ